jgi:hypothetical protein
MVIFKSRYNSFLIICLNSCKKTEQKKEEEKQKIMNLTKMAAENKMKELSRLKARKNWDRLRKAYKTLIKPYFEEKNWYDFNTVRLNV